MKCPNPECGAETGDTSKFCPECGSKISRTVKVSITHVVVCSGKLEDGSQCLNELKPELKFCPECGLKVVPELFKVSEVTHSLPASQGKSESNTIPDRHGDSPTTCESPTTVASVEASANSTDDSFAKSTAENATQASGIADCVDKENQDEDSKALDVNSSGKVKIFGIESTQDVAWSTQENVYQPSETQKRTHEKPLLKGNLNIIDGVEKPSSSGSELEGENEGILSDPTLRKNESCKLDSSEEIKDDSQIVVEKSSQQSSSENDSHSPTECTTLSPGYKLDGDENGTTLDATSMDNATCKTDSSEEMKDNSQFSFEEKGQHISTENDSLSPTECTTVTSGLTFDGDKEGVVYDPTSMQTEACKLNSSEAMQDDSQISVEKSSQQNSAESDSHSPTEYTTLSSVSQLEGDENGTVLDSIAMHNESINMDSSEEMKNNSQFSFEESDQQASTEKDSHSPTECSTVSSGLSLDENKETIVSDPTSMQNEACKLNSSEEMQDDSQMLFEKSGQNNSAENDSNSSPECSTLLAGSKFVGANEENVIYPTSIHNEACDMDCDSHISVENCDQLSSVKQNSHSPPACTTASSGSKLDGGKKGLSLDPTSIDNEARKTNISEEMKDVSQISVERSNQQSSVENDSHSPPAFTTLSSGSKLDRDNSGMVSEPASMDNEACKAERLETMKDDSHILVEKSIQQRSAEKDSLSPPESSTLSSEPELVEEKEGNVLDPTSMNNEAYKSESFEEMKDGSRISVKENNQQSSVEHNSQSTTVSTKEDTDTNDDMSKDKISTDTEKSMTVAPGGEIIKAAGNDYENHEIESKKTVLGAAQEWTQAFNDNASDVPKSGSLVDTQVTKDLAKTTETDNAEHTDNTSDNDADDDDEMQESGGETFEGTNTQVLTRNQRTKLKNKSSSKKEQAYAPSKKDAHSSKTNQEKSKQFQGQGSTTQKPNSIKRSPSGASGSACGSAGEETIRVHFHVLVSKHFKLESKDKQLVLKSEIYGNWNEDKVLTLKRMVEKTSEMELTLEIPKHKLTTERGIKYKYCIVSRGKNVDKKVEYESYRSEDVSGIANRTLAIPRKWQQKDEWHQYDGVVERDPGFVKNAVNIFISWNDLVDNAFLTIKTFAPVICEEMGNEFSIQEGLDQLDILISRMRRVYLTDNRGWVAETRFKEDIGDCLVKAMLETLDKTHQKGKDETPQQTERRLIVSIACVYLRKTLITLSIKSSQLLCEYLQMKPDRDKKECLEIKLAEKYFPKRKELKEAFVLLAKNIAEQSKNPSWLLLMPWIHFLSDAVKPYQEVEVDLNHDSRKPVWWGTSHIGEDTVKKFKENHRNWEISTESLIAQLLPLFEMDVFLPRSIMAVVQLENLNFAIKTQKIPVEVCLATLIYYLKTTKPTYDTYTKTFGQVSSHEKRVHDCLVSLLIQLQEYFISENENRIRWEMCYNFSIQLHEESLCTDRGSTMYICAQIYLHCHAVYFQTLEKGAAQKSLSEIKTLTHNISQWLRRWCIKWDKYMESYLKFCSNTFAPLKLQSEEVGTTWNYELSVDLMNIMRDEIGYDYSKTTELIRLYCDKTDELHKSMQDCLSKIAFKAIDTGYTIDYYGFKVPANERYGDLLSRMFLTEWLKHVHTGGPRTDMILRHVFYWPSFLQFLKIRVKHQDKMNLLHQDCLARIQEAIEVIKKVVSDLLDGSITLERLDLIEVPDNRFHDIAELVMLNGKQNKEFFLKAVEIRKREVAAFKEQAKYMATLTALCEHMKSVDRTAVDQTLDKQRNIEKHCVKEFCIPVSVDSVKDVNTFTPHGRAFKVEPSVILILPELYRCNDSSTFVTMWQQKGVEIGNQPLTLEDVVEKVWKPVKDEWDNMAKEIQSGEITFLLMERMIGSIYREDYDAMRQELFRMGIPEQVANERLVQMIQYRHLETCIQGAKVILDFFRKYELGGNIEDITTIASYGQKELKMRFFDKSLIQTCTVLMDLTEERAQCLERFVQCTPLVKWLKASMRTTGLKELKVFVDLAFMSAGEEPLNVKRVQCLYSAVTGYAPLIFDLKPEADYKELLRQCDLVWIELKANPALPQQLVDTNRQLEWLKDVKKAHGSVEVTSLVQADAINTCGVYTVGKNSWKNDPNLEKMEGLMQVLQLKISEVEGKRQKRYYNFSQLQDLQSRLMLVAGKAEKGSAGVENFTMVFDSIVRMSKVYIQLCSAGCVLFKGWTARFWCDNKRPVCAVLEFGDTKDTLELKGRRNDREDLKEMIPKLANFMERCYEHWLGYIKGKRAEYLHLNFFTVDQLVILQRELVKYGTEDGPSHLVYPLLSAVKQDCTPADLVRAMAVARRSLQHTEKQKEADATETDKHEGKMTEEAKYADLRETFIEELLTTFDRALVEQALEHVSVDDIDAGILWCMNHNEDVEKSDNVEGSNLDEDNGEGDQASNDAARSAFTGWNSECKRSIQTLITSNVRSTPRAQSDTGFEPLLEDLQLLWKEFLGSLTSNVKDYLSLEHLGLILTCLAKTNMFKVDRSLPPGYQEGAPNLLVCPSDDVLPMVLSVYMTNKDQPLPQPDEVLVCTLQTTMDEVDIFWQRALFGDIRKMHCLANVDLLDYDVNDAAERHLEEYRQSGCPAVQKRIRDKWCTIRTYRITNNLTINDIPIKYNNVIKKKAPKYKLVVICGSDNENRSRIVSSLDKFRRTALPINLQDIQAYLEEKLQVCDQPEGGLKPASFVDFSNSSVRLVKSWRAGVGKTLFIERQENALTRLNPEHRSGGSVSIPLHEKNIDLHYVMERLLRHSTLPGESLPTIFHFDVAHEVQGGVDYLLFNLLVLGFVVDKTGYVWQKSRTDLYLIETMPLMTNASSQKAGDMQYVHKMLSILPDVTCRSPRESLDTYTNKSRKDVSKTWNYFLLYHLTDKSHTFRLDFADVTHQFGLKKYDYRLHEKCYQDYGQSDQLFDNDQFRSSVFQRPFQYLWRHDQGQNLDNIDPNTVAADPPTCIYTLLRHCGIQDPSWAELHNFVWFLNTQLQAYETNNFVCDAAAEDLPGFAQFVLRFLINMSRDFSNRSLNMSEQSPGVLYEHQQQAQDNEDLELYQMRRTWESSPHPYLFINYDSTFTFLGFNIERATGNMIDQQSGEVLEKAIMAKKLYDSLVRHSVPIRENFDALPRDEKILKLCSVMGIEMPHDPDDTYELTTDNVKKIMAIFMRFKCDIPVIIMGETGCGKTRLIKFMCSLQIPPGVEATNMILMKVHGGTTNTDIKRKVEEAERSAKQNQENYGKRVFTVLFFDEANTTESIGLIKEIMCDKTLQGKKLTLCENLKIVAACNPYRKHSDELIKKLEQAGLGYHVDAEDTADKLGRVPMRRLVYRVQPLPQSLLPLVWDFGQLNTQVEDLYIRQMVRRYVLNGDLPNRNGFIEVVSGILTASQDYMRQQNDECSFVSLRDVDRVLSVMSWFYQQSRGTRTLFNLMDKENRCIDNITRSLVLALGVCYHACLRDRDDYRTFVAQYFRAPCPLPGGAAVMEREINRCQDVYLESVQLEKNIAKNMALKENVFMMTVCIELRIPLFLVGKPGSSKSLAKTIVSDAMQGNASRDELFRELKQVQMVSFQCSPLATPEGIVGTFRQCAQFQEDKDLDTFVSTVVLDEVGLAEDSPRMPLKTLHPLLEDGCQGDEKPEEHKKVAFIGISNWALDPAKMNRGILVQREVPDLDELKNSARGICTTDGNETVLRRIEPLIKPMAESYLAIFDKALMAKREFYGLRDFYSLVKMVYAFTEKSTNIEPTWHEMKHAILRNFGGLEQVNPVKSFKEHLSRVMNLDVKKMTSDPDCTPKGLIEACLFDTNKMQSESRYLLLLTENYGALNILQQEILARQSDIRPITIFGSSFRSDQEYTQVCRNINKIKVCMETGNTVVLLNLENLYESLYDALNQYYVYFGGERYVDLGLGTHRVKCPVHKNFRLIVVAEKQTVYDKFPIPLINRLEKHFLTLSNMLSTEQHKLVKSLDEWARNFVKQNDASQFARKSRSEMSNVSDVFMGFHDDTCSAVIKHVWQAKEHNIDDRKLADILHESKKLLLWCATPDAVVRLSRSDLGTQEQQKMKKVYCEQQAHHGIAQYLKHMLTKERRKQLFAQVTTHSKLLPTAHKKELAKAIDIPVDRIMLTDTLSSFDTEQQFSNKIQQFLNQRADGACMLIVQCDSGDKNANLVACARYCVMDEFENVREELKAPVHVVFIIQLPRIAGGCFTGFQCGVWHSVHIDDLRVADADLPTLQEMEGKTIAALLDSAVEQKKTMETDETTEIQSLNVQSLILSCVQSALSMVKDKEENKARTTDRVPLVLKLFHPATGKKEFLHGVCHLISILLKDKERNMHTATNWLIEEAAKCENIRKAGTFRRSCLQTLESKISPILAGIIAYLDTNQNLDILLEAQTPWQQELWLSVLNTPRAIPIKFEDLQSPNRRSDLQEVIVTTTGCAGHLFSGRMPFSWLIRRQLDDVLEKAVVTAEGGEEIAIRQKIGQYVDVLSGSDIGNILYQCQDSEVVNAATNLYVADFIHMVYRDTSKDEHTLVCQSVMHLAKQLTDSRSLLSRLVSIHIAYDSLESRLVYFHTMNCVWPECSQKIIAVKDKNPDKFKEEEFTFSSLCLLIEDLTPDKTVLNKPVSRSQWLQKVYKYRQVIEKVISLYTEDPDRYGGHSHNSVLSARCLWSRVMVVKLFLEHVCASEDKDAITIKHCMPLWLLLKKNTNLKEVDSLGKVETFLKTCNMTAIKEFMGQVEKCCACEIVLEGPPLMLPCNDILCDSCLQEIQEQEDAACPKCKAELIHSLHPVRQIKNTQANQKLQDYQRRCNSFFMDIVSQLCFSENTPPSEAVIDKLLKYVLCSKTSQWEGATMTITTKEISVFDTGIDPTPVFRSFLLQLLIRTSSEQVTEYLRKYLREAEQFIKRDVDQEDSHYVNLSLLIIQCFEDIMLKDSSSLTGEGVKNGISYLKRAARGAVHDIDTDQLNVEKLCGLAEVRIGLTITVKCIVDIVTQGRVGVESDVRRLIEAAQDMCTELRTKMPRTFLVKYLCRRYGMDTYQEVCRSQLHFLRWIGMKELDTNERVECADRYVVCGNVYTQIREALTKGVISEDTTHLSDAFQGDPDHLEVMIQLAVHREITNSNLYSPERSNVTAQVIQILEEYFMNHDMVKNKAMIQALLHNRLGRDHLVVQQGETLRLQGPQCLVMHFMSVLKHLKGDRTLMQPLMGLMKTPQNYQNAYLPTMPQDDLEEVKDALLAARSAEEEENPVFYRCPNGHPYIIGDCGRPYVVENCPECGEDIGGKGHALLEGNTKYIGVDQTAKGHCLDKAGARAPGPKPERALTPLQCACLRLLIHMAMYAGTIANCQGVEALIWPHIDAGTGPEFLWQHIMVDLEDIQRGVGKSVDDVLLLMHVIINTIMTTHKPGDHTRADVMQLTSKQGRTDWEQKFSLRYLKPVLQDVDATLNHNNQLIVQDQRLGADPLMCLLYEKNVTQKAVHPGMLQDDPTVWRYRTPISLEHLRQEFDARFGHMMNRSQPYIVLQHFLREDHHMRAIRYIPSILKLHRILLNKYLRRLDKEEASAIQIIDLKRDDTGQEIVSLVEDFAHAWELLREDMKVYVCPTELGGIVVSKEYCSRSITDDLPIAYLLPTTRDMGLCSYALLDFLMRKQNAFLTEYMKATGRNKDVVSLVSPKDITTAHLISYDPDQDILPLVLANCKYSFEMGTGTTIEYDFQGLERQLMDRFLFSKSKIRIEETLKIELMVYRAEVTNALVFKKLAEKIPQEVLSGAVKTQISSEIRSLPDLCTSLYNLDIAISFLTSVGGEPDQNLYDFMAGTLKMENSLTSQKARQECQYQHAQSLWLHLSLIKSKQIADHHHSRESMFDNIEAKYHETLPDDVLVMYKDYMKRMSVEKLSQLVEILHEYIVLQVSVPDNRDDADYVDTATKQLFGWLYGYIDAVDRPSLDIQILDGFPQEILICHCSHTWTEAYTMLQEKINGQKH